MVISMKHITLIGPSNNKEKILEILQNEGVVDIEERELEELPHIDELYTLDSIKTAIDIFNRRISKKERKELFKDKKIPNKSNIDDVDELCSHIIDIDNEIDKLQNEATTISKAINTQKNWGDFDYNEIKELESKNILRFQFWFTPNIKKVNFEENQKPIVVSETKDGIYFITIEEKTIEALTYSTEAIFSHSMKELNENLELHYKKIEEYQKELRELSIKYLSSLELERVNYTNKSNFEIAKLQANEEVEGKVYILNGWCPVPDIDKLEKALSEYSVYTIYTEPSIEDENKVPVAIKNNSLVSLFEPITKLFMLPKYFQADLTFIVAPFFVLFFGLCLGDAGWGIVILVASIIGIFLIKKQQLKKMMLLGLILGSSALVIGVLTGTIMGVKTFDVPGLQNLIIIGEGQDGNNQLFYFALIIGIVQIYVGLIINTIKTFKRDGFALSLYPIGIMLFWISIGLMLLPGILEGNSATTSILSTISTILLIISLIFIFFFNSKGNIFKRFGLGFWSFYNVLTGFFGDVLSYIRLFALGLAGSTLGLVINQIAGNFLNISIPVLNYVIYFVFLITLHGVMIALNSLGSFVHPMRLTFVEFYNNAGFEGTMNDYKPFALEQVEEIS